MKIAIINGPNLNLLGKREPDVYGAASFDDCSNIEGELINELQRVGFTATGIIFNPGGYTHTSVAIGDTVAAISTPVIEVHISNVHAREDFRKISHVSAKATGSIVGLGLKGYQLAVEWFVNNGA
jgi:3-dehydroquinate dehydratase-2